MEGFKSHLYTMSTLAPKHPTSFFIYKPSENCLHLAIIYYQIKRIGPFSLSLFLSFYLHCSLSLSLSLSMKRDALNINLTHKFKGLKWLAKYQTFLLSLDRFQFARIYNSLLILDNDWPFSSIPEITLFS